MRTLLRVLVVGFAAVMALLAAAAIIEVNNARAITGSAAELVNNQLVAARLLDEVERGQGVLSGVLYRVCNSREEANRERLLADLDQTDNEVHRMVAEAQGSRTEEAWNNLERAVVDFSQNAREVLTKQNVAASRDLFLR